MNILPVHKIESACSYVNGEVVVRVRPTLPVEGTNYILGSDLAGNIRANVLPSPYVTA